jgi:beta-lactamase regulating signal transducer with metallopeptidase domain
MRLLDATWMSPHWTATLTDALLHFVWQGALIGLLTVSALNGLRSARASTRYAVVCAAFILLVAAPIVTMLTLELAPSFSNAASHVLVTRAMASVAPSWARNVVLLIWGVGVCVFGVRALVAYRYVVVLRAGARAAVGHVLDIARALEQRMRIRRRVRVVIAAASGSPSVVGWLRPVLLLPAAVITGLTPEQLETIIAHELAHVRRHDYLVSTIQLVAETLLFYHPVTWWLSARLREERELCCDDIVVETCGDAVVYARALAESERRRVARSPQSIVALGANDGALIERIRRLLGIDAPRRGTPGLVPLAALAVVCVLVACVASAVDAPRAAPSALNGGSPSVGTHEARVEPPRYDGGIGTPNPNENGEASYAATKVASRSIAADSERGAEGSRLVSIQLSGVSRELRDRMNLPIAIGDTIHVMTNALVVSRLREVDSTLHSSIVPVGAGRAALLIAIERR